jgi:hypothetical protein
MNAPAAVPKRKPIYLCCDRYDAMSKKNCLINIENYSNYLKLSSIKKQRRVLVVLEVPTQ